MAPRTHRAGRARTMGTTIAVVALALTGAGVSGCGSVSETLTEKAVEGAAEAAGEGDVQFDVDDEGVTIESEDGSITTKSDGSLPEGFPSDIPLPEGEIQFSQVLDTPEGTSWSVQIASTATVDAVTEQMRSGLEPAGYSITSETTTSGDAGDTTFLLAERDTDSVQFSASATEGGSSVSLNAVSTSAG